MMTQPIAQSTLRNSEWFGVDYERRNFIEDDGSQPITVSQTIVNLQQANLTYLQTHLNPLWDDGNYVIDHYLYVLQYLSQTW